MNFGFITRQLAKKNSKKTASDYKREMLIQFGRDQLMKLTKRGLSIPVALL